MKKFLLLAAVAMGIMSANAQDAQYTLAGSKFADNWSIGLKGGAVTPLKFNDVLGDARGIAGAEIRKQITPIFGLGIEGEAMFNTAPDYNSYAVDHSYVGVTGTANLMNLFAGYKGSPRVFEIETVLSAGWLHAYISEWFPAAGDAYGWDKNAFATKAGLNLNFNLGKAKAWTLSIKPAVVWDMDGLYTYTWQAQYNVNRAVFELQGGVTYHFKNSNGTHHFNYARLYDQAEVDDLNAKINALRGDLENCKAANDACIDNTNALNAKIAQLEIELAACKAREPEVQFVVKENQTNTLNTVRYVFFRQGRSTVSADQMPNVEQIATYLKNHKNATVVIKGYASPEGNADVNARIAKQRAESVKDALVKKYGISASRISADGQGVGEMFSEPDWNRVSICTIEENDKK